jgi:hypothetical protein
LWRLDEATGIWDQTGTATRVGSTNVFEADVTSFSFYNLDRPIVDPVTLTVTAYEDNAFWSGFNTGDVPAPGVAVTVDILDYSVYGNVIWQGRGITNVNGQLVLEAPAGFLRVKGIKGLARYEGVYYEQGTGTANINLFKFVDVPLQPPAPGNIDLVMAAGNTYDPTPTSFLIVEDASALVAVLQSGPWYPTFANYSVSVVDIVGDTIELSGPVTLTQQQGQGVTISFNQG